MNMEPLNENPLNSNNSTSENTNKAHSRKKGLTKREKQIKAKQKKCLKSSEERAQRVKAKQKKRIKAAEEKAQRIKAKEERARQERRASLLLEALVNQERRERQAEIERIKQEQHRILCQLWIEQQNIRQQAKNPHLGTNKQNIIKPPQEIEIETKNKSQYASAYEAPINKLSSSQELTTCPLCHCSIRVSNLEKHAVKKCPEARRDLRYRDIRFKDTMDRNTRHKKEGIPKFKQKISIILGQCSSCGRAAVPGTSLCYGCSS